MAIHIKSIRQIPISLVFTDHHPFDTFRRIDASHWECLVVDRWEPEVVHAEQLERLFLAKMNGGN